MPDATFRAPLDKERRRVRMTLLDADVAMLNMSFPDRSTLEPRRDCAVGCVVRAADPEEVGQHWEQLAA